MIGPITVKVGLDDKTVRNMERLRRALTRAGYLVLRREGKIPIDENKDNPTIQSMKKAYMRVILRAALLKWIPNEMVDQMIDSWFISSVEEVGRNFQSTREAPVVHLYNLMNLKKE